MPIVRIEGRVEQITTPASGKCHFVTLYQDGPGIRPELCEVVYGKDDVLPKRGERLEVLARVDVSRKNPEKLSIFRFTPRG